MPSQPAQLYQGKSEDKTWANSHILVCRNHHVSSNLLSPNETESLNNRKMSKRGKSILLSFFVLHNYCPTPVLRGICQCSLFPRQRETALWQLHAYTNILAGRGDDHTQYNLTWNPAPGHWTYMLQNAPLVRGHYKTKKVSIPFLNVITVESTLNLFFKAEINPAFTQKRQVQFQAKTKRF